jgi:uncharacterized protein (DUF1778 family)
MARRKGNGLRLEFRLPAARKARIERAALVQNRSLAEFAIAAMTEVADKVLEEEARHEHVTLSDRDRDRFLAMLDAPPAPNEALKAAARRHRQQVVRSAN